MHLNFPSALRVISLSVFILLFGLTSGHSAVNLYWNTTGYTQYGMPNGWVRAVTPAIGGGVSFDNSTSQDIYQEKSTDYQTATALLNFGVSLSGSEVSGSWDGEVARFVFQPGATWPDAAASDYMMRYSIGVESDAEFEVTYRFSQIGGGQLELNQGYAATRLFFGNTDGEFVTQRFSAGTYYLDFYIFDYFAEGGENIVGSHSWSGDYEINFNAVPEPSSWALIGLGAALIGLRLTRHRNCGSLSA